MPAFIHPKVGLALGGGAARGFAHLGVIQALEEAGLAPDGVAGTSIGAIIGALWASEAKSDVVRRGLVEYISSQDFRQMQLQFLARQPDPDARWRDKVARALKKSMFLGRTYLRESYVPREIYRGHLLKLLPDRDIESLAVPFAAMASCLYTGRSVVFRNGSLRDAVIASGAIPGVMPPLELGDHLLVDGVATDRIPTRALVEMGLDLIVAVDVATDFKSYVPSLRRGATIHDRSAQVTEWNLRQQRLGLADIVIRPDVAEFNPLDFYEALPAIDRGYQAMKEALPELRRRRRLARFGRLAGRTRAWRGRWLERKGLLGEPPIVI